MDRVNGHKRQEVRDDEHPNTDPDLMIYEIVIKVLFYEPPAREDEVLDHLELSGEEIAKMIHGFKDGGFLPMNCRVILNTNLKKQYLSSIARLPSRSV